MYICTTKKARVMTKKEIKTLENRVFRLECEKLKWRNFRDKVNDFLEMKATFGKNTLTEIKELKEELESIKYY